MMNEKQKRIVKDLHGGTYELLGKIGEGGQGTVLKTDRVNLVVKITNVLPEVQLKEVRKQFQNVMRLPLRDLKIALPLSLLTLKNRAGYVMELMDGLEPLSAQIERMYTLEGQLDLIKYRDTGSFARRLLILKELAETLARLHGKGLAFGDLSPNNIFVSTSIEHHRVWLIDADNIHYAEQSHQHHFYTKGYAAPELIRNETGTNAQTDAWSFAVIALQLLTHTHPFNHGIAVEDEDLDIAEEKAARGEFPWVFDVEDDSNEIAVQGFPVFEMLNKRLFNLFQRCFGSSRLAEKLNERPTMAEWHYELHRTLSLLLMCQEEGCSSTFIVNKRMCCPFCLEPKPLTLDQYVRIRYWGYDQDPIMVEQPWFASSEQVFLSLGQEKAIYHEPHSYFDNEMLKPWFRIALTKDGLKITPETDDHVILQNVDGTKSYTLHKTQMLKNHQKGNKDLLITHSSLQMNSEKMHSFFWRFTW
ncbi:protein kinase domain-containing protein [Acinetobacter sp. TR3]|uniref:protein kinase domain-containing protein n=1 Tax=Acinetobacter sp. TR3 TaxID=3003392 RepID=UPI0022AC6A10|nr:protein kinase [Acinetobacter sp. TR3]WAU77573.1 protein kinase [Acinetobacter sp. TR3]